MFSKRATWITVLLVVATQTFAQQIEKCGSIERRDELSREYPESILKRQELELYTQNWISNNKNRLQTRAVITIPVVVHIIWSKNSENISDSQILSQLAVINKDFRNKNVEAPNIPSVFKSVAVDVEFEFCLAAQDPKGNPTTGITRTYTSNTAGIGSSRSIFYTNQGGRDTWDTGKYLNIYVAKFAGSIAGISSFPGSGPAAEDAVVINYLNFGTLNTEAPYHLGRTTTHELGHYFNLEHPWGPKVNDCCADDFVNDTPPACDTYLDKCPTHPVVTCNSADMFMNYMFYTDDSCMGMFTNGQKLRMLATLNGPRAGLLTSTGCQPVNDSSVQNENSLNIYPNPIKDVLFFEIKSQKIQGWRASLINPLGVEMFSQKAEAGKTISLGTGPIPPGVYFLLVENGADKTIKRVIKL